MKKIVLKVELYDDRIKQKAMKAVSGLSGVESVSADMKDKKLTIIGDTDPVNVVAKLRKLCHTEIVTVEEQKKKEEPKKQDQKKPDPKENVIGVLKPYEAYGYYPMRPEQYYYARPVQQDPYNGCVIC